VIYKVNKVASNQETSAPSWD